MACKDTNGINCEESSTTNTCSDFQLTKLDERESCILNSYVEEHLNIGGADVHIFPLLGVHEQGDLTDLTGNGVAFSSGAGNNYPATNAFNIFQCEWRSNYRGMNVTQSAFIGYDFGEIKLDNSRVRYGVETNVMYNIATIKIKQGSSTNNRATKARIERSQDGKKWFGVAIVNLPDDDLLNTIHFKHSVPSRYWRIRPTSFNGSESNDYWTVQALELIDYDTTSIDDIQDPIFQENRDRDYSNESKTLKMQYDLQETQSELTQFGIELPSQSFYLQVSFSACVSIIGRPIVIGDILEIPSEAQFSFNMEKIKKYVEVIDVGWAVDGYTPGYTPTILRIIASPMIASQETMDLFDNIADEVDENGLSKYGLVDLKDDHDGPQFQDDEVTSQFIQATDKINTPELGADTQDINIFNQTEIDKAAVHRVNLNKLNVDQKGLYIEDAMPPNGIDFSEGEQLPDANTAIDGSYHRLIYSSINKDIPARLFRFSSEKNRWIFVESDKRSLYDPNKPVIEEYHKSYNNPTSSDDLP